MEWVTMRATLVLLTLLAHPPALAANDCAGVAAELKLPVRLKLSGKPKQADWARVEKVLTRLREATADRPCELTFEQVFSVKREDAYFPLISNLLRTAPEEALKGASVYGASGRLLGNFENRVTFNKQGEFSYTHYYFQFSDREGNLQSSGNRILVDTETGKPFFLLRWDELKGRTLISGQ